MTPLAGHCTTHGTASECRDGLRAQESGSSIACSQNRSRVGDTTPSPVAGSSQSAVASSGPPRTARSSPEGVQP